MVELRIYTPDEILAAAAELSESHAAGLSDAHGYGAALCRYVFRDGQQAYWALEGRSRQWYAHRDGRWTPQPSPPPRLEGPDGLAAPRLPQQPESPPEEAPASLTLTQGLEQIVELFYRAYQDGQISSYGSQELLAERFLLDKQGRAWMVGARSRRWYAFVNGEWKPARSAPAEAEIIRQRDDLHGEPAERALAAFTLNGMGGIPEAVTEPWQPSAWHPEAAFAGGVDCGLCSQVNPPGSLFCNRCGDLLAAPAEQAEGAAPAPSTCRSCGAALRPGRKFCTACGAAAAVSG
ncbi:MAG: zinc ribbon domain-containing protein [Chloroflexi bacterium]|nr:zinc ribbon domain-containing protein [Chloroflexota bacterium]